MRNRDGGKRGPWNEHRRLGPRGDIGAPRLRLQPLVTFELGALWSGWSRPQGWFSGTSLGLASTSRPAVLVKVVQVGLLCPMLCGGAGAVKWPAGAAARTGLCRVREAGGRLDLPAWRSFSSWGFPVPVPGRPTGTAEWMLAWGWGHARLTAPRNHRVSAFKSDVGVLSRSRRCWESWAWHRAVVVAFWGWKEAPARRPHGEQSSWWHRAGALCLRVQGGRLGRGPASSRLPLCCCHVPCHVSPADGSPACAADPAAR